MRNSIFAKGDREYLFDSLHIFVLSGFAVTQPLFDLLSRNAEFFVVRRSEPVDIILLVYFVCIVIPALVVAVEMAVGLWSRRVREKLHGVVVASLVAVIALPALNRLDGFPGTALLISAAILGVGMSICYVRFRPAQMFLTVLSPALLIFPSLFLFNSPVSKLVFSGDDSESLRSNVNGASPVVIVVFDELAVTSLMDENRQIDPIRYPNFAALAREATWFRNATTVADNTVYGVPAILTGNYPDFALLPTAADHPNTLRPGHLGASSLVPGPRRGRHPGRKSGHPTVLRRRKGQSGAGIPGSFERMGERIRTAGVVSRGRGPSQGAGSGTLHPQTLP